MKNKKILIIAVIAIVITMFLQINVYAENEKFVFDEETVDVDLNGQKGIYYSGGTGSVTWESSDPSIATVDSGTVTGLKIGTVTITATRGSETATCKVNVVYTGIQIGANASDNVSEVNLVLNEHETETLVAKVKDGDYAEVSNAQVSWESSDPSIVTVEENTGALKAIKTGTATITAKAAGVEDTCVVTVFGAPVFTDFSKAQYQSNLDFYTETLQITGITPTEDNYYYFITPTNVKPDLVLSHGRIDTEAMGEALNIFTVNTDENYMYSRNLAKYTELNQDLYLWVVQETELGAFYYETDANYISYSTKFVVEGKQLARAELPKLNLIMQTINIGYWSSTTTTNTDNYTYMKFNFPSDQENRKFSIKIGKVTDNTILSKIQNNDYSGITDLLSYAKNNNAVYSQQLTTTSNAYFRADNALFDGRNLLENKAYYYIYVQFDDENGKYYPIEGVTLGQAWFATYSDSWDLWAYTSDSFNWDNLTPSTGDTTVVSGILPQTGTQSIIIAVAIILVAVSGVVCYVKYNKFRGIN